uniref:Uncharacterized protein n=1 Tax=Chromera velia CCMP2878 TaxID=1169474 RepID=A0A0G4HXK8_9ALVE|eukprot:Cvel_9284.t1-p1 / transcript=Cvel_9284.t1 / gene=Cvel_9284 / organism=Chromera_velia_CCMP2878 / gene_product=hypothetical protein / transcript_product=hypothetical protein / location=Cvel_scaffold531:25710-30714(-) / protein_length=1242 / sequence_SO=supercontig / SO=protein_coding / is_pseudo=false
MKVPEESSGVGGRRRLGRRSARADEDCGNWESGGWTESLCNSAAAGECGCTGEAAALMQTEYGFFASVLLDVISSPDLSVLWQFEKAEEGLSADNLALWVFVLLLLGFLCHLVIALKTDVWSPRSPLSVLESAYLSNRPVLAAAWDSHHSPQWGTPRYFLQRLQDIATDAATVAEGRYQHAFSIEAAYPLTLPKRPPEIEPVGGESEGATAGEREAEEASGDLEGGGGIIGYRQTDLVCLLMHDALKVRKQIQVQSLLIKRKKEREADTSVVVVEPETCLIEDRNLSADHLHSEQPTSAPLWDVRPPPILPVSLRFSLFSRWRRDVRAFPFQEEGWDHIAAARFLVQSGAFRERLEQLARQQAGRWALARDLLRRFIRQRRSAGGRGAGEGRDQFCQALGGGEDRQAAESHRGDSQKPLLFSITLRGFLLPWSSAPSEESASAQRVRATEFGLEDRPAAQKRASVAESIRRASIPVVPPRLCQEDSWRSEHISVQMKVSPRGFLKITTSLGANEESLSGAVPPPLLKGFGLRGRHGRYDGLVIPPACIVKARLLFSPSAPSQHDLSVFGCSLRGGRVEGQAVESNASNRTEASRFLQADFWQEKRIPTDKTEIHGGGRTERDSHWQSLLTSRLAGPPTERLQWLKEDASVSILRLFVRCPNSPSGIVGLDISRVREVECTATAAEGRQRGFTEISSSGDSSLEERVDLLAQGAGEMMNQQGSFSGGESSLEERVDFMIQGVGEMLEQVEIPEEVTDHAFEGPEQRQETYMRGGSDLHSSSSEKSQVIEEPGRSSSLKVPFEETSENVSAMVVRGQEEGRGMEAEKEADPDVQLVAGKVQVQELAGGEDGRIQQKAEAEDGEALVNLSLLILEGEERLREISRALPIWEGLENQIESDMKRLRFFSWSAGYLHFRLFFFPLLSLVFGVGSRRSPGVSRSVRVLERWTSTLSWLFFILLFFGVLSTDVPIFDDQMTATEFLVATIRTFNEKALLAIVFVYAFTLPVRWTAQFFLHPHTPQLPLLKNVSVLHRRGQAVEAQDVNAVLWEAPFVVPPSQRRKECRHRCQRRKKDTKDNTHQVMSVSMSILPPSYRHREKVEGLVRWRREEIKREKERGMEERHMQENNRRGSERSDRAAEEGAGVFRASKKWILPEAYRAYWLHRQKKREIYGVVFCLSCSFFCFFYFSLFALVYPIRTANVIEMTQSALGLFLVNGIVRPLTLAAFVGISCSVLVNILHRPDIAL